MHKCQLNYLLIPYIIRDNDILGGEPVVKGTRTSVRAIVEWWKFRVSPEEILENFPNLTLSQVFDALSYYADHRDETEKYIAENMVKRDNP